MKIHPVGAELFQADGRTDERTERQTDRQTDRHDEANCRFSQFFEPRLKTFQGIRSPVWNRNQELRTASQRTYRPPL
jgi:hypothetical protein